MVWLFQVDVPSGKDRGHRSSARSVPYTEGLRTGQYTSLPHTTLKVPLFFHMAKFIYCQFVIGTTKI